MKRYYLLTKLILFSFSVTSFAQVTVSITHPTSSVIVASGSSTQISVFVSLTKPSNQATVGNLNLYMKRNASTSPVLLASGTYISSTSWAADQYFDWPFNVTVYSSDFDASGGSIFAQYEQYASSPIGVTVTPPVTTPIGNNTLFLSELTITSGYNLSVLQGSTPQGGNNTFSYQWQQSTNNSSWSNISGATSKDYDPPVLTATIYYRRIVNSGSAPSSISNVMKIKVLPLITPGYQNINSTQTPSVLTCEAPTNLPSYSYQWQIGTYGPEPHPYEIDWQNISGATSQNYQPPIITTLLSPYKYIYRRVVITASEVFASHWSEVSYELKNNLIYPETAGPDVFSIYGPAPTGGTGTYSYQWQRKAPSTSVYVDLANATQRDYLTYPQNGLYRRKATSGAQVIYSNEVYVGANMRVAEEEPSDVAVVKSTCFFPNPCNRSLNFNLKEGSHAKLEFYSSKGQLVNVLNVSKGVILLPENISAGIYTVTIRKDSGETLIEKLIVTE